VYNTLYVELEYKWYDYGNASTCDACTCAFPRCSDADADERIKDECLRSQPAACTDQLAQEGSTTVHTFMTIT
jgi:hypothetical protein